ncbi:MAG: PAS domain S-box protein [Deltaproteobacteria bacterium]|nr:PAS domain S-box protein [Deltaproteobacteria bacterium]
MTGMNWGGDQVQALIEETGRLPDVLYLTVVNKDGIILAHSDKSLIGSKLNHNFPLSDLNPSTETKWTIIDTEHRRRIFEAYRYFKPISDKDIQTDCDMSQTMEGHTIMTCPTGDWCCPICQKDTEHIIFAGLDISPFEDARKEDIRNSMVISGVLVILGLTGFISMFWMQNYRSTKRSLQDTRAFADEVVASLPVGLIATDNKGKIAFFNSAAEKITGLDLSKARGNDPETILPDQICGLWGILNGGKTIHEQEMECEFIKGKYVPVSASASKIINEDGQFVGQVLILRDLEEVRRLQDEIRRKEKLAAIGSLAAGVAHEIRNPLSSIKGIASYFKSKFAQGSDDGEVADVMINEADRLNRVVSELLEFARPTQLNLKETDINALLKHSVRLVQQESSAMDIKIDLNLSGRPLIARIDPDRFLQCLLNLYLNALQAMGKEGRLSVFSTSTETSAVQIDIRDTGPGIKTEDMHKIFDPYFTTKARGTGLGLTIVYNIIEAHQGRITAHSAPGRGASFTIVIPDKQS